MKKIFILLFAVLSVAMFSTSCQNDGAAKKKAVKKAKKQNRKGNKKKNTAKFPALKDLKKSKVSTRASVGSINGTAMKEIKKTLSVKADLEIKGTAVDAPAKNAAAGVYVQVGKKHFLAEYGQKRDAFAKKTKNNKYLKSGFSIKIPKDKLEKGEQKISLKVVSKDRKSYYLVKDVATIKVR